MPTILRPRAADLAAVALDELDRLCGLALAAAPPTWFLFGLADAELRDRLIREMRARRPELGFRTAPPTLICGPGGAQRPVVLSEAWLRYRPHGGTLVIPESLLADVTAYVAELMPGVELTMIVDPAPATGVPFQFTRRERPRRRAPGSAEQSGTAAP